MCVGTRSRLNYGKSRKRAVIFDLNWGGIGRKAILKAVFKAQQIRSGPPTTAERRWHRSSGMCHAVACLSRPRCRSLFTAECSLLSILSAPPTPTHSHGQTPAYRSDIPGSLKNPCNPGIRTYSLPPSWGWIMQMMECVKHVLDAMRHLIKVKKKEKKESIFGIIVLPIVFRRMKFNWQLGFCWLAFCIRIVRFGSSRLSKTDTGRTEKVLELGW